MKLLSYGSISAADHRFDETETKGIHNKYVRSLTRINKDILEEYRAVKGNKHSFMKGRFKVHFAKVWGSKAFFMHLDNFGTLSDMYIYTYICICR